MAREVDGQLAQHIGFERYQAGDLAPALERR
jgi:hypothetical protein